MSEMHNASQFPRLFYARHMQPGTCGYENETILVDTDAIKRMIPSFVGMPVYIHHQKVELDKLEETAAGYIVESFYNELDGWAWVKIIAVDDDCHKAISKGWAVSNAYRPIEWGGGGTKNNCPFKREVMNAEFTHLAIVPNPRYEGAKIFTTDEFKNYQTKKRSELDELQNSKTKKGHPMLKIFQRKTEEVTNAIPADADLSQIDVEIEGRKVPLSEMINAVKKNDEDEKKKAEDEKKEKENKLNDDTEISVGDEKMPLKTLMNKYNAAVKKNAEDAEKDAKAKEADEKKNAEEKERKDKEDKENAARFQELQNAHKSKSAPVETSFDKTKRGQSRYGSTKK